MNFLNYLPIIVPIIIVLFIIVVSYRKAPTDKAYVISGLSKIPRILIGRGGFQIPLLERLDKLTLELIQISVKASAVPTMDFINVDIDAVANVRIPKDKTKIQTAAQHFLNLSAKTIAERAREVLEGNMREIVGQIGLKGLVQDKAEFSRLIQTNASEDIMAMGLEIVSLNVQNVTDEQSAISNLGVDNLVSLQKSAAISRANAERDIQVEKAKARQEGNKAEVAANQLIAEQNKDLAIKQANFKQEQDTQQAIADAAYRIQEAEQAKLVNEKTIAAEAARAQATIEVREKEITLKERELDATVRKAADAEKYQTITNAEAAMEKQRNDAEAVVLLAEAKKKAMTVEAEGIKAKMLAEADGQKAKMLAEADGLAAKLQAEAEGVRLKGLAEAEALDKKIAAQSKLKDLSVIEAIVSQLPAIAENLSKPFEKIDNITMYGNQTGDFLSSGTQNIDKVLNIAKDSLGVDLKSLVGGFLTAKALEPKTKALEPKTKDEN